MVPGERTPLELRRELATLRRARLPGVATLIDDGVEENVAFLVMEIVNGPFHPEFLNRLDEILLLHRLSREHMAKIVDIQLDRLGVMLEERKIVIAVDEAARNWLADAGYDPVYGARPLKRVIQRALQNSLATMVLEGKIADGERVEVTVAKGALAINGVVAEAA